MTIHGKVRDGEDGVRLLSYMVRVGGPAALVGNSGYITAASEALGEGKAELYYQNEFAILKTEVEIKGITSTAWREGRASS